MNEKPKGNIVSEGVKGIISVLEEKRLRSAKTIQDKYLKKQLGIEERPEFTSHLTDID